MIAGPHIAQAASRAIETQMDPGKGEVREERKEERGPLPCAYDRHIYETRHACMSREELSVNPYRKIRLDGTDAGIGM